MVENKPESKPQEIRTGADKLLDLVRNSKEVAMSEAAKQLGVPPKTIESWANFLEEDGSVMIRYKFTTPYISVPETQGPKVKSRKSLFGGKAETAESGGSEAESEDGFGAGKAEVIELKTAVDEVRRLFTKAIGEKNAGEFGLLKETYSEVLTKLKSVNDKVASQAELTPQKKVALNEAFKELDNLFQEASDYVVKGQFDKASISYSKLYAQAQKLSEEINQLYEQVIMRQTIEETKDYKDMLGKAYQLMSEGKVEEAKRLYERLKFTHENLAKEFVTKKLQMEEDLVKLVKDLAKRVDELNLAKLNEQSRRITGLLTAGNQFLKKGELGTAESYYLAIKHEYTLLPRGFAKEKKELQQEILDFYSLLSRQREKVMKKKFDYSVSQILSIVKETQGLVKENRIDGAIQLYKQIKQLYNKLPQGFLEEKAELQEKVLSLYAILTSIYTQDLLGRLKSKSAEILTLLKAMESNTEKGELKEAEEMYERIKLLYKDVPKGFLHEETTLQNEIVRVYENYLNKAKQMEDSSSSLILSVITRLLEVAEGQLSKNDYEGANNTYLKLIGYYNTLPTGFIMQKTQVRERILRVYKILLSKTSEGKPLEAWQASAQAKQPGSAATNEILNIIVNVHTAIAQRRFEFLNEGVPRLYALAGKLPNLAKTNPRIFSRIADFKGELELCNRVSSLPKLFESGQLRQLKYALDFIRLQKEALKKKCPEDKELFGYASSQHDFYLSKLISNTAGTVVPTTATPLTQPVQATQAAQATTQTVQSAAPVATKEVYLNKQGADLARKAENEERGDIANKIDELKSLSKATVKPPQLLQ